MMNNLRLRLALAKLKKKRASSVSIIGGASGPTSIFIAGKKAPKPGSKEFREKALQEKFADNFAKFVKPGKKSMKDLEIYLLAHFHAKEIPLDESRRKVIKSNVILNSYPDILATKTYHPGPAPRAKDLIKFEETSRKRFEESENYPEENLNLDMHVFQFYFYLDGKVIGEYDVEMENNTEYITIGYHLNHPVSHDAVSAAYNEITYDIFRFIGVSQEDIDNRTNKFITLMHIFRETHGANFFDQT